jgi:hypothetical protein
LNDGRIDRGDACMRGFVITILSISFMVLIVMLAFSLRNAYLATERSLLEPLPLLYSAFLLDDLAFELNSLLGPGISLNQTNASTVVSIRDTLHTYNHSADILGYESFVEGEVAERTASSISANFSNMTGGTMRMFINGDYEYVNDEGGTRARFFRDGGSGAKSYDINITVYSLRENVTHMQFNESGTLNVTIRYTDLNGTQVESGRVFPGQDNHFAVSYPNGTSIAITTGLYGGNPGSLVISASGTWAEASFTAVLPPLNATRKLGYEYDATIDYAQGPVSVSRRIGK